MCIATIKYQFSLQQIKRGWKLRNKIFTGMTLRKTTTIIVLLLLAQTAFAAQLRDYPSFFFKGDSIDTPFALVVGDNAAASDVAGGIDIAVQLQQELSKRQAAAQPPPPPVKYTPEGFIVGKTSDLLEIGETLGSVREALTELDLDVLKGGQLVTREGRTAYRQYIRFPEDKGQVIFNEDEKDRVGDYLNWDDGDELFTWEVEFDQGLESTLTDGDLEDLEDEEITLLGTQYTITTATYSESTGRLSLTLLGGAASTYLGENEKETYTINGKDYLVEVLIISEQQAAVKFRINGQITPELKQGEATIIDGVQIGIGDVTTTEKEGQKNIVQFFLGAARLQLEDNNALDNNPTTAGLRVNGETIEDSDLKILASKEGSRVRINKIIYRLFADSVTGDIFIKPGQTLRNQLNEPEGLLAPGWDIAYDGLAETGTTSISYDPAGNNRYRLEFTNQEGINYKIPLLSNEDNDGKLSYGDDTDDLWFIESNSDTTFYGNRGDYFVLSNCNTNDNTCFTHVVRYTGANTGAATSGIIVLSFNDLGTGNRDITLSSDGTKFTGELIAGGVGYKIFASNQTNGTPNIAIDLNADGSVSSDEAIIGTKGEGLIDLGTDNTNSPNTEAGRAIIDGSAATTLRTLKKEFDKADTDEVINIPIEPRASNGIGIQSLTATSGTLFGPLDSDGEDLALSAYGTQFELDDPSGDRAETLTIDYPTSQRGATVRIIGGPAPKTLEELIKETETPEQKTPFQPRAFLASEIGDITTHNAIIMGGPCANHHTARLLGNPQPCWESIPLETAIIRLIEQPNGKKALIIAGREAKDTRRASIAVTRGHLSTIPASSAEITGGQDVTDVRVRIR